MRSRTICPVRQCFHRRHEDFVRDVVDVTNDATEAGRGRCRLALASFLAGTTNTTLSSGAVLTQRRSVRQISASRISVSIRRRSYEHDQPG